MCRGRGAVGAAVLALVLVLACGAAPEPASQTSPVGTRGDAAAARGGDAAEGAHSEEHAGDEHGPNVVELSPEQLERLELTVEPAPAGSAGASVSAPATVAFDPDRVARVGPRLSAQVVRVVRDLGDRVEAGDTVAILDSVALGKAKARYLTARARLDTALASYEREKSLAAQKISSQAELLDARARLVAARAERDALREELRLYGLAREAIEAIAPGGEEPLSYYRLHAPTAGVIQRRDLVRGETVQPGDAPVHIVDTRSVWVWIDAFERDLPRLATGQPVEVWVRALPEARFSGTVGWISRELDEKSRTLRLRAVVDNPEGLLRAGMFGTARIRTGTDASYALVPVDAVQTVEGRAVVFVPAGAKGRFRARPVRPGEESEGRVEIHSGLRPGDRVVVAGAFDLKSALTARTRSAAHAH